MVCRHQNLTFPFFSQKSKRIKKAKKKKEKFAAPKICRSRQLPTLPTPKSGTDGR